MIIFDQEDPLGKLCIPEIAKTGANCIRIAWGMANQQNKPTKAADLDKIIQTCKNNGLVPIVGLWDFTDEADGGFSKLDLYVQFWKKPAILKVITKHQNCLLLNIANEAAGGDENVPADVQVFADAYKSAVRELRAAGIKVPLVIDGMDRGKSIRCFSFKGNEMLLDDPLHNLLFSFHPYWPKRFTEGNTFIDDAFTEAVAAGIPFIIGEISKYGGFADGASICSPAGEVEYMRFIELANTNQIGWLVWEWGPGNASFDAAGNLLESCPNMDATTDRTFDSLSNLTPEAPNFWLKDLILENPIGITNTSLKTAFLQSGFKTCEV